MPVFGSFSLLLALALSGYTLLAGAFALRQLAIRARTRISPERLAETARRAGIASFFATSCRGIRAGLGRLHQRLLGLLHPSSLQPRAPWPIQIRRALVRPGGITSAVGMAAGHLRLRAPPAPQSGCPPDRLRLDDPRRRPGLLPAAAELRRAALRAGAGRRARLTASA